MTTATLDLPKVMVVEDDISIQRIINHYIHERFQVIFFNDGMDALAYLQEGNLPDIIVADLNIPEISGLELLIQVKASGFFSAIPVLMLSGEESSDIRIKCLEAGADDYIVKPFNPRELEARMRVILNRSRHFVTH